MFGKEHKMILRKINALLETQPDFGKRNFALTSYTTDQNKTHPCYEMTRDGFCMVAMSLTGQDAEEWKIKYIKAFNIMEDTLKTMLPRLSTLNTIVKKAESDKKIASECGAQLAKYKEIKRENDQKIKDAINIIQLELGFKK